MYTALSRLLKAGAVLLALTTAAAAEYPDKQIRLIIPFPPGGSNDVVGRLVALQLSEVLGQQVYASAGVGSFQYLGGELFKLKAGVNIVHVPFRGGGPAMIDVIGGHTKIVFSSLIQITPHIKSGQLRGLATGGAKRNPVLPDLPTIAEAGVPGYEANNWWGMLAPAGTTQAIVEKLNKAVSAALDAPELQKQFEAQGASVVKMSPAEFGAYI